MSQENVELARRAFEEVNSVRNRDEALRWLKEFCDPDVEWDFSRRGLDGAIYHGYEGWLSFAGQFRGIWQEFHREVQEILDAGDSVVIFTRDTGVSESGIEVTNSVGQVSSFRNRKMVSYRYFGEDRLSCLKAVGLEG
jgi:ketosteroid isomerase-like protein